MRSESSEENKNKYLWLIFVVFLFVYIIYSPERLNGIVFHMLLLLLLVVYLMAFKRFSIIKNALLLQRDEISSTVWFVTLFLLLYIINVKSTALITDISMDLLFQTLSEELVFRAFLVGILIEGIPLSKINTLPFFWADDRQNKIYIILYILLASVVFSNFHIDWLIENLNLIWRTIIGSVFASAFVLTNKKIYAPWIVHYIYNTYAIS